MHRHRSRSAMLCGGQVAATASMMARQKGVRSSGVRDVIMFLQLTTGSSTHSAPALSKSSLTATKDVIRTPLATGTPSASRAEQNIHGLQREVSCRGVATEGAGEVVRGGCRRAAIQSRGGRAEVPRHIAEVSWACSAACEGKGATRPWQIEATGFFAATIPEMTDSMRAERRM